MRRLFAVLAFIALSATSIRAQQTAMRGAGAATCAQFAQNYHADPSIESVFFQWALGYMSAINDRTQDQDGSYVDLDALSNEQQLAQIRQFCNDNPLDYYRNAVLYVFVNLTAQHPSAK
jgi:hypothetical protein